MALIVSAAGPASVQMVWDRYVTPEIWPGWAPHIQAVSYPYPTLAPGTVGELRGPAGARLDFRIDAVDEMARRWSWTVSRRWPAPTVGLRAQVRMDHGVQGESRQGSVGGSRAWVRMHLPAPVALLYAPLARIALSRLVSQTLG